MTAISASKHPLPAFFNDLLQTKALHPFRPLGHPTFSTGSPRDFHWVTQAASVFPITATCPGWPWMTAITRDHGDLNHPLPADHNDHNIYWVSEGAITMGSQFLLDLSDATCMKPNIHAAFRDFDPADFCLLLARSQHLKDLVWGCFPNCPGLPWITGTGPGLPWITQ